MRILNAGAVAAALPHNVCVAALAPAMRAVSAGKVELPLRQYLEIPATNGGKFTSMPGFLSEPRSFGIKLVAKFPREPGSPLGSHTGGVMLFDADQGVPTALLDGSELTAIRTAAASALATQHLARRESTTLAILGTGMQARHHALAVCAVMPIAEIRVWGRDQGRREALATALGTECGTAAIATDSVAACVSRADVICTTTSAREPILFGEQLEPGQHLNLVGAAIIESSEVDVEVVRRSRVYVDYRASARAQAGELALAQAAGLEFDDCVAGEIGEVLAGAIAGRESADQITTYKSLGVAAQDLAAAHAALQSAEAHGHGVVVDW